MLIQPYVSASLSQINGIKDTVLELSSSIDLINSSSYEFKRATYSFSGPYTNYKEVSMLDFGEPTQTTNVSYRPMNEFDQLTNVNVKFNISFSQTGSYNVTYNMNGGNAYSDNFTETFNIANLPTIIVKELNFVLLTSGISNTQSLFSISSSNANGNSVSITNIKFNCNNIK